MTAVLTNWIEPQEIEAEAFRPSEPVFYTLSLVYSSLLMQLQLPHPALMRW